MRTRKTPSTLEKAPKDYLKKTEETSVKRSSWTRSLLTLEEAPRCGTLTPLKLGRGGRSHAPVSDRCEACKAGDLIDPVVLVRVGPPVLRRRENGVS